MAAPKNMACKLALSNEHTRNLQAKCPQIKLCDVCLYYVVDTHIQHTVLATEEATIAQQVSHGPIKYQSRSWSRRGTTVNSSYHGNNPLVRSIEIQIATKSLPGSTNRKYRKLTTGVKTVSLGIDCSFYCHVWSTASIISEYNLQSTEKTV